MAPQLPLSTPVPIPRMARIIGDPPKAPTLAPPATVTAELSANIDTWRPITATESVSVVHSLLEKLDTVVGLQTDETIGAPDSITQTQPISPISTPVDFETPTDTTVLQSPDNVVRTAYVPILMYHYLSNPPADADIYRLDLSVSPDLFARQLDAMLEAGYTTISLYDLIAHLTQGAPLPEYPVVITFDDGYRDNYENAFPLLRRREMVATFFIVTDFIDEQRPAYLSWDMVREMLAGGMSIESHGRNHVSLRGKDSDYLVWQALGGAETIEFETGRRPRFISYPAGSFDALTQDIYAAANYIAGLTTIQGATHSSEDLFTLHRVRVRGSTEPAELLRLLEIDW